MKLVINVPDYIKEQADDGKGEEFGIPLWLAYEIANGTPLPRCKDCKWWKDSDGAYRRGVRAESRCPINTVSVANGVGYCYMFKPQESEDKAIEQGTCANIPFLLHKEFGCPLDECVKAYEKANEYLRSKSKLKG